MRCAADPLTVVAAPVLLDVAGNSVAGDPAAKRTFHHQTRRAFVPLAGAIGLDPDVVRFDTTMLRDYDEYVTELSHADLPIRIVPCSFLPDSEITINRCRGSEQA